jgi:hypothetical protein
MARPKAVTKAALKKELPETLCDIPTCTERAEIIVEDKGYWLTFCPRHNPTYMKNRIVFPLY